MKLLNNIKNRGFFWEFQVMLHMFRRYVMYLDIGRADDDDYDDGESSNEDYYK